MVDLEKEREAFEELSYKNGVRNFTKDEVDNGYCSAELDYNWHIWIKSAESKQSEIAALKAENIELQKKYQHADTQLSDIDGHYTLLKKEVEALKAKLEKVESGEFVVVPKSEIGNYYFDDSECIYIDEPDSFLSELDVGEVCEVKRRDYFDLPTQYAAKVFIDIDNIEWRLFESELEAEIAANECKDKFWGEQGDGDE